MAAQTTNPTELSIWQSGQKGSDIADKIIKLLEQVVRADGTTPPTTGAGRELGKECPRRGAGNRPGLLSRTDVFYVDSSRPSPLLKACEIKYSQTAHICPGCRKSAPQHGVLKQSGRCNHPGPFVPTHKNCHQRFIEAWGKSGHWMAQGWIPHFFYFDLVHGGTVAPSRCPADLQSRPLMEKSGIRVMHFDHDPTPQDYADMVKAILTP